MLACRLTSAATSLANALLISAEHFFFKKKRVLFVFKIGLSCR